MGDVYGVEDGVRGGPTGKVRLPEHTREPSAGIRNTKTPSGESMSSMWHTFVI
jgi:hypothetical protein